MANNTIERKDNAGDFLPTMLVVGLLLFFFFWMAWYFFSPYLALGAAKAIIFTHFLLIPFTVFMDDNLASFILDLEAHLAESLDLSNVPVRDFLLLVELNFKAINTLVLPLLIYRGISNLIFAKSKNFTRKLSLRDLAVIHASRNPRMKPPIHARLEEQDHRFGSWRTSMNPLPYLILHGLVTAVPDPEAELAGIPKWEDLNEEEKNDNLDEYYGKLQINQEGLRRLLLNQLGIPCAYRADQLIDIDRLPTIDRAMAVVFIAAALNDRPLRKRVEAMLDQFGDTFVEGNPPKTPHQIDLSGINELWDDIKDMPKVKRILINGSKKHAYWTTFFTYLFGLVYDNYGTMSSADFRFLKPVNRKLFLLCDQVGLERARSECAAIRSHYAAETKAGFAILSPQTSDAFKNIALSIQMEGWLTKDIISADAEIELLKELNDKCAQDLQDYRKYQESLQQ